VEVLSGGWAGDFAVVVDLVAAEERGGDGGADLGAAEGRVFLGGFGVGRLDDP
jgi:hypothetical protein